MPPVKKDKIMIKIDPKKVVVKPSGNNIELPKSPNPFHTTFIQNNPTEGEGSTQTQLLVFGGLPNDPTIKSGDNVTWESPHEDKGKAAAAATDNNDDIETAYYLTSVTGPLQNISRDKENYSEVNIHPIACRPFSEFRNSTKIDSFRVRVAVAREAGASYNGRAIPNSPVLTRSQERATFKPALDILEDTLTMVNKYQEGNQTGYELDEGPYQSLCTELINLRNEAYDSLIMAGKGIPKLPCWGRDGNISTVWSYNDFEILGATYRIEVENFLSVLGKVHKFVGEVEPTNMEGENRESVEQVHEEEAAEKSDQEEEYASDAQTESTYQRFRRERNQLGDYSKEPIESISQALRANSLGRAKTWTSRRNPTTSFGYPLESSNGKGWNDMFGDRRRSNDQENPPQQHAGKGGSARKGSKPVRGSGNAPDPGPPDDDDDDGKPKGSRKPYKRRPDPKIPKNGNPSNNNATNNTGSSGTGAIILEPQFDNRLKIDVIPTWDGDIDTLGRWILKINRLSERSSMIYKQLGMLVPLRLTGAAETWYYSQGSDTRYRIEQDWGTLRDAFGSYYMNRAYMDRQKARANRAAYRDIENPKETPSEYFICKLELLELVYDYTDIELINEVMAGAPSYWITILTPHLYQKLDEFQLAIKFHELNLLNLDVFQPGRTFGTGFNSRNPFGRFRSARTNLVGWSKSTINPPFPKDDSNISPRGTPEEKGARPCRHCGSGKHWDPDCKYARKGEKRARVNMIETSAEEIDAQNEYDALYFENISDEEQDF